MKFVIDFELWDTAQTTAKHKNWAIRLYLSELPMHSCVFSEQTGFVSWNQSAHSTRTKNIVKKVNQQKLLPISPIIYVFDR